MKIKIDGLECKFHLRRRIVTQAILTYKGKEVFRGETTLNPLDPDRPHIGEQKAIGRLIYKVREATGTVLSFRKLWNPLVTPWKESRPGMWARNEYYPVYWHGLCPHVQVKNFTLPWKDSGYSDGEKVV